MLRELSLIIKCHVSLVDAPSQSSQFNATSPQISVDMPKVTVHMVDIGPTTDPMIPSIIVSNIPLGYISMSKYSTIAFVTTHTASISVDTGTSTTSSGGIGTHPSIGGGGGHDTHTSIAMHGTHPPPPPGNPIFLPYYRTWGDYSNNSQILHLPLVNLCCPLIFTRACFT